MSRDPKKDAAQVARTKQKILEAGFRVFADRTIEKVTMNDVAVAAGIGVATLYRYYSTKAQLVLEIGNWIWRAYTQKNDWGLEDDGSNAKTAAEVFIEYLDTFISLYQNHRDALRFNQFYNIYVQSEGIPAEQLKPYHDTMRALAGQFHQLYEKGRADGTLRTEKPEAEMFSATLHLMMAVVTRYAVGLVYRPDGNADPVEELRLLEKMMVREYVCAPVE